MADEKSEFVVVRRDDLEFALSTDVNPCTGPGPYDRLMEAVTEQDAPKIVTVIKEVPAIIAGVEQIYKKMSNGEAWVARNIPAGQYFAILIPRKD